MCWIVGGNSVKGQAASTSQMGRFGSVQLGADETFAALRNLSGAWIDNVQDRRPPEMIILDMDSSVSPTYGEHEGTAYNGHFGCTRYHRLFVFTCFSSASRSFTRTGFGDEGGDTLLAAASVERLGLRSHGGFN